MALHLVSQGERECVSCYSESTANVSHFVLAITCMNALFHWPIWTAHQPMHIATPVYHFLHPLLPHTRCHAYNTDNDVSTHFLSTMTHPPASQPEPTPIPTLAGSGWIYQRRYSGVTNRTGYKPDSPTAPKLKQMHHLPSVCDTGRNGTTVLKW